MSKHFTLPTLIFVLLCVASLPLSAAGIHRWVDSNGKVHYSDKPPSGQSSKVVEIKRSISSYRGVKLSNNDLPSSHTNEIASEGEKRVIMYSASWCGVCQQAKQYFRSKGIPFRSYDIETSAKGKRGYARLKGKGVPIILIGKRRMDGFSAESFQRIYDH